MQFKFETFVRVIDARAGQTFPYLSVSAIESKTPLKSARVSTSALYSNDHIQEIDFGIYICGLDWPSPKSVI